MLTRTKYLKSIKLVDTHKVIKPGSNNKKLGFRITCKKWKGMRLFSVTLEERATCPPECHHWDDCYGNNMPFAHRFSTDGLLDKLRVEVAELCTKYPDGIVIRLHVLGDFYSVKYVEFWQDLMLEFPNLNLFGYTGRREDSDIGKAIFLMNLRWSERALFRFSINKHHDGMGRFYAADESFEGASFVCPEQTGKVASCADCGLCWSVPKTVRFLSH